MVLKMMKKAQVERVIQLFKSDDARFEDGGQMRDFIYVKDAVRMTCDLIEPSGWHISGLYNIGRGQPTTWNALAGALFFSLGTEPCIRYIDMPKEMEGQYQNYTCADMNKFHKLFPPAQISIDRAVLEYVQDYLMKDARW